MGDYKSKEFLMNFYLHSAFCMQQEPAQNPSDEKSMTLNLAGR